MIIFTFFGFFFLGRGNSKLVCCRVVFCPTIFGPTGRSIAWLNNDTLHYTTIRLYMTPWNMRLTYFFFFWPWSTYLSTHFRVYSEPIFELIFPSPQQFLTEFLFTDFDHRVSNSKPYFEECIRSREKSGSKTKTRGKKMLESSLGNRPGSSQREFDIHNQNVLLKNHSSASHNPVGFTACFFRSEHLFLAPCLWFGNAQMEASIVQEASGWWSSESGFFPRVLAGELVGFF